jgi:hypothetical protein
LWRYLDKSTGGVKYHGDVSSGWMRPALARRD